MVKQYKVDEVANLVAKLKEKSSFILTNYSGIKVRDLGALRKSLRANNAEYKVVKNSFFKRALNEAGYSGDIDKYLKGPVAVAFVGDNVGETAKILKEFSDNQEKFSYSAGVIDSVIYDEKQMSMIANLPSKEVLLAKTMSLMNGPTSGIAMGLNQIMSSLARGIKAVAEKNA